jgi:putative transposase
MSRHIEENAVSFGVEPICRTLGIAPSSHYAARSRPPSARALADEELKPKIVAVHRDNLSVYGAYKLWRELRRKGESVGRDRVARLMGLTGLWRQVRQPHAPVSCGGPECEGLPGDHGQAQHVQLPAGWNAK